MNAGIIELRACLASLEQMIQRASLLSEEYDRRIRKVDYGGPPVSSLKYSISFPEVRSLDLLCKDMLERVLPNHPEIAAKWYVYGNKGVDSPEDLHSNLVAKRTTLQYALDLLTAGEISLADNASLTTPSLPREYQKLADSVRLFFEDSSRDCQDYDRNVFIMTRFQAGNRTLEQLDAVIRKSLLARGLVGHRADDRCYPSDRNLWDNVCTYMLCCKFGIAILENILVDEFNPNVALEYGFMIAQGKPTLLLKEQRFKPRADILGTLWQEFDILAIESTVPAAINKWQDDLGIDAG